MLFVNDLHGVCVKCNVVILIVFARYKSSCRREGVIKCKKPCSFVTCKYIQPANNNTSLPHLVGYVHLAISNTINVTSYVRLMMFVCEIISIELKTLE